MIETSSRLLVRLRTDPEAPEWAELYTVYRPFLYSWARREPLQHVDAEDVVQEVFVELRKALPKFSYDRSRGRFRDWLRAVLCNRIREFRRSPRYRERGRGGDDAGLLEQLEDPLSTISRIWDMEHDRHVVRHVLIRIRPEFAEAAWQAFHLRVFEGLSGNDVAQRLGMRRGTVDVAKCRVLRRLREVMQGFVEV